MSLFSKIFNRKSSNDIENFLSDHKAFSNNMSDENKQKLDKSRNLLLQKFQEQYFQRLSELSTKQRWDFAFALLNDFNIKLPFDLLKDIIPDIPAIHNNGLDSDMIEIMLDDIENAKHEYGFTISELGEFSELLAKNSELSLSQSYDVINHVWEIAFSNYSQDEFENFLTCLDTAIAKVNTHS